MAGTNLITCRQALIAALTALAVPAGLLDGVTVDYSYVGKRHSGTREYLFGGTSEGSVSLAAMQGGSRVKREETPNWPLTIYVTKPGEETTEDADVRAVAIGAVLENYVALNVTLGGSITGLLKATIPSWSLTSWVDDDAAYAVLTYQVEFHSYLS